MNASDKQIGQFLAARFDSQRHRESAFEVGTRLGITCFGSTYLLLSCVPQVISAMLSRWRWGWLTPTLQYLGGVFLCTTLAVVFFALVMRLLARSQGALDSAKSFFVRGYLIGAVAGAGWSFWEAFAPRSISAFNLWALFSEEITKAALLMGSGTAVVATLVGVVLANSRQATREQRDAWKTRPEPWETTLQESYDRQLAKDDDEMGRPMQIGIGRMLILTAAIACLIAMPNMVHQLFRDAIENSRSQLLETRTSEQVEQLYASYSLGVRVAVATVSIFIAPYLAWVIIRGPDAFRRMRGAIQRWRRFRREKRLVNELGKLRLEPGP